MPEPITYTSASPRHSIPLLFSGQSQREFIVNEAYARIDTLLHPAIEGTSDTAPPAPGEGECWLVGDSPDGAWTNQAGAIASYQAGGWIFATPRDGMTLFDRATSQQIHFRSGWVRPSTPIAPSGGTTVDVEARAAIAELVEALVAAAILAQ